MDVERIPETLPAFLAQLDEVEWFANLGEPLDAPCVRGIGSWDAWPGPETEGSDALHLPWMRVREEIVGEAGARLGELNELWREVQARVIADASQTAGLDYDPDADARHGPTACVWHAGATAALVAWCLATDRAVPELVARQWRWFARGHWPFALGEACEGGRELMVL